MVKKIYQCEECKNYFEEKDILDVLPAQSSGKAKIHVCSDCFRKQYKTED
ncbi:MAG: hypothetical protein ACYCTB_10930 [bacterium]